MSNPFFRIEMLPAKHGDALLVEYGDEQRTRRILIDGGPLGAYPEVEKRLKQTPLGDQTVELLVVTHVDTDHVEGIIRMMNGPDDFIGPVNLGNPDKFTIRELAELVIELSGSKSRLVHCPLPEDDPTQRKPDIALAREKLGWEPKVKLRDGLVKTIDWFHSIDMSRYRAPTPNF